MYCFIILMHLIFFFFHISTFHVHMFLLNQLIVFFYQYLNLKESLHFFSKNIMPFSFNLCWVFNASYFFSTKFLWIFFLELILSFPDVIEISSDQLKGFDESVVDKFFPISKKIWRASLLTYVYCNSINNNLYFRSFQSIFFI